MFDSLRHPHAFAGCNCAKGTRPILRWPSSLCLTGILTVLAVACGGGGGASAAAEAPANPDAPKITAHPASPSQPVAAGDTATFTVEATSPEAVTYQWQRGTASIDGADKQSYTIPQVKWPDDNGATFRVVVTNTKGSRTSNAATLTVKRPSTGDAVIVNHLNTNLSGIPTSWISAAKSSLKIAYGHTSHGSQLVTGMAALASSNSLYSFNETGSGGAMRLDERFPYSDLGNPNFTQWAVNTRDYLQNPANAGTNVVIWSWCGQVSHATEDNIKTYLSLMTQLENDYPSIMFVYMTGHLDGSGTAGTLHQRNNQIRAYCQANDKILFDFADIESYDPSGNEFLSKGAGIEGNGCAYSGGNWASQWIAAHPTHELTTLATSCGSCAHSEKLNCIMKGRAAWWLWARLAGWSGQ